MRHIISVLLQNEAGALSRVTNLFSTRGFNIESLNVAPTDDETVSRLTVVSTGSDAVIEPKLIEPGRRGHSHDLNQIFGLHLDQRSIAVTGDHDDR